MFMNIFGEKTVRKPLNLRLLEAVLDKTIVMCCYLVGGDRKLWRNIYKWRSYEPTLIGFYDWISRNDCVSILHIHQHIYLRQTRLDLYHLANIHSTYLHTRLEVIQIPHKSSYELVM